MNKIMKLKHRSLQGFPTQDTKFLKVASPIASDFVSNLMRFWYQKKAHIFLITPRKFYGLLGPNYGLILLLKT